MTKTKRFKPLEFRTSTTWIFLRSRTISRHATHMQNTPNEHSSSFHFPSYFHKNMNLHENSRSSNYITTGWKIIDILNSYISIPRGGSRNDVKSFVCMMFNRTINCTGSFLRLKLYRRWFLSVSVTTFWTCKISERKTIFAQPLSEWRRDVSEKKETNVYISKVEAPCLKTSPYLLFTIPFYKIVAALVDTRLVRIYKRECLKIETV